MSRSRKPHGRPAPPATGAVASTAPSHAVTLPTAQRPIPAQQRRVLLLVTTATVLWILALALMALLTSNPTIISHDQLLRSDAVVIGHLVDKASGRLRIEQVLSGKLATDDEVTIDNWSLVAAPPAGPAYLVPLTRFRQNYIVTVLDGQRAAPLIYPALPETIGKARQILDGPKR